VAGKPITLGSTIITLIEPHRGHEVACNRWYEEDHIYAILLGPSAIAATRFVARRQEKAMRQVAPGLDPDKGSLLAVYWLVGDGADHAAWRKPNRERLERDGRVFLDRDFVFGFVGPFAFSLRRDASGVPAELALDHRFPHAAMSIIELDQQYSRDEVSRAYREGCGPLLLGPRSPVASCVGFFVKRSPDPGDRGAPPDAAESNDELVVLWFCDTDPSAEWEDLVRSQRDAMVSSRVGTVIWVSPFIRTVAGTDTYMDELSSATGG